MAELNQDFNGTWKINNLKHDKSGITIPARFGYNGDWVDISITSTEQTINTNWKTQVGVPISISSITRQYTDVTCGGTTYHATDNFSSSSVHPVTNYTYSIEVSGPNRLASGASGTYTAEYVLKIGGVEKARQTITNEATWSVTGPGTNNGNVVTNTNSTADEQTITVKATYGSGQAAATGTLPVTAEGSGGGGDTPRLTITYTGSQVTAASGTTSDFTITAQNATVTGYTVNNGASITASGASSVTVSYPANQNESQTKTYTVTVRGKDSSNNLVTGSTTFTQAKDSYTLTLSPASDTINSDVTSYTFTVSTSNVTNVGYDSNNSSNVTGRTVSLPSATAKFSANTNTGNTRTIKFALSGKTLGGREVYGVATLTQRKKPGPTTYTFELADPSTVISNFANIACDDNSTHAIVLNTTVPSSGWGVTDNRTWITATQHNATTVYVTFANNGESGDRTGTITITADSSYNVSDITVSVTQHACPPSTPVITITDIDDVRADFANVPCSGFPSPGYTFTVTVTPASEWTITEDTGDMWAHVSKSGNQAKVVIDQNGLSQRDTTLIIDLVDQSLGAEPVSIPVTQEACTDNSYIHIEGEETHSASAVTHILDQGKTFTYSLDTNSIVSGSLGTASTVNHTTEHAEIDGAWIGANNLSMRLDGRTLEHIGTGYVTNYIDVTGTSVYGGTVRATLILRIELEKATIGWYFSNSGIPTVPANTSYELLVDGSSVTYPGASRVSVTYVRYSTHSVSFSANVGDTSSFPAQTITANTLAVGTITPNSFSMEITLTNYGPYTSTTQNVRMDDDGDVNVSFNWQQTNLFSLITTQAGCTVVMNDVEITSSSQANQTYTVSSVNSSITYEVSKSGYYPETGTIYSNRTVTVTLEEIVGTYEDVRTEGPTQLFIVNNSNQDLDLGIVTMELYGMTSNGRTNLGTWTTSGLHIPTNGSTTVTFPGYGLGTKQVSTNTSPEVEVHINQFNGNAYYATVQYPQWQSGHYDSMSGGLSGEGYDITGSMPTLTHAPGSTYVFPHDRIQITFS